MILLAFCLPLISKGVKLLSLITPLWGHIKYFPVLQMKWQRVRSWERLTKDCARENSGSENAGCLKTSSFTLLSLVLHAMYCVCKAQHSFTASCPKHAGCCSMSMTSLNSCRCLVLLSCTCTEAAEQPELPMRASACCWSALRTWSIFGKSIKHWRRVKSCHFSQLMPSAWCLLR